MKRDWISPKIQELTLKSTEYSENGLGLGHQHSNGVGHGSSNGKGHTNCNHDDFECNISGAIVPTATPFNPVFPTKPGNPNPGGKY